MLAPDSGGTRVELSTLGSPCRRARRCRRRPRVRLRRPDPGAPAGPTVAALEQSIHEHPHEPPLLDARHREAVPRSAAPSAVSSSRSAPARCTACSARTAPASRTLIKVLVGAATSPTRARSCWEGEPVALTHARRPPCDLGISTIYQELDLVPDLSVAENIFLGHELATGGFSQRGETNRAHARAARAARPRRDPGHPLGRPALAGRAADREHGARPVAGHPAARPGRAVRRARPGRGRQPLPRHPRPHRRGRRRRLHLPPARGDPPDRRPDHRPQGRQHRRHRARGRGHPDVAS